MIEWQVDNLHIFCLILCPGSVDSCHGVNNTDCLRIMGLFPNAE